MSKIKSSMQVPSACLHRFAAVLIKAYMSYSTRGSILGALLTAAAISLTPSAASAKVIPADLPPVDLEAPIASDKQYDEYTAAVHKVLNNFDEKFPQYKDQGFEVAGFVWWQGHKDGPNPAYNARYKKNMVNLIKAWRKEFNAPDAPWSIATVGFHGEDMPEHYFSFDPKKGPPADRKDKVRYREVELPAGMENWYAKAFDPSKAGWKKGKAPFGQKNGELKPLRKVCGRSYSKIDMMPNTLWEKEVLLMHTEMKMPKFDPDYRYRMVVGGAGHAWMGEGYALYINGELVSENKSGNYKNAHGPRGGGSF